MPPVSDATIGIDLAAEPRKTAAVRLAWHDGKAGATVESVEVGLDDRALLAHLRTGVTKVGIDCPFGWPRTFVDLVSGHAAGAHDFAPDPEPGWRRDYYLRRTDRYVAREHGVTPLSVAADRIAHPAIRLAYLFGELGRTGERPALDGSGRLAEVYPGVALRRWGLERRGYKKDPDLRGDLLANLRETVSLKIEADDERALAESDDAFDALVCALVARAIVRAGTEPVPEDEREAAREEGWIHVPNGDLRDLS
ncbi:DUF429 domain-containing protein [Aeromicrobium sp. 179-A 4D2 NHS]|uniref:DUF429 domain-containing protein n=1 Tax=Aeromicrobium sp. 179-A 4D2 NHS TaxID=3142375 RepID=UPI0039A3EE64